MRKLLFAFFLLVQSLLTISCREPTQASASYNQEIVMPALNFKRDLAGEAPKPVITCVYQFYLKFQHWPKSRNEFDAFASNECASDGVSSYEDIRFEPATDGGCMVTMLRRGYAVKVTLPKP